MKIAHRVAGFAVAGLLCGTAVHAQSDVAVRYEVGGGVETLGGGRFVGYTNDPLKLTLRATQTAGVELSWASPTPSLRFTLTGQLESHPHEGWSESCSPGGCTYWVPTLLGGEGLAGAQYAVTSRLSFGMAAGLGYLGAYSDETRPSGSLMYSLRGDMALGITDHVALVARAEQLEMPDYGGAAITGRSVTLQLRFR